MSLAENVLQLIEDAAKREGFTKVKTVSLEIGRLAVVEPEALDFCFEAVTRGSIAEGAALEIVDIPGGGWCKRCQAQVEVTDTIAQCPQCEGFDVVVNRGTEMRVKALDVI